MQQKLMKVYEKELKEETKKQKEVRHSHFQTHHALIFSKFSSNILLPYGLKL